MSSFSSQPLNILPRRLRLESAAAVCCLLFGALTAASWLLPWPQWIDALQGSSPVVFNTAVCFLFAGLALLWQSMNWPQPARMHRIFGIALAAGCALLLLQDWSNVNLGLDWRGLHERVASVTVRQSIEPGRMDWHTALAFVCAGLALALIDWPRRRRIALLIDLLCLAPAMLGALTLIDYGLGRAHMQTLQIFAQQASMGVPTALVLLLLSAGLWTLAERSRQRLAVRDAEDERILRAGTLMLIAIALLAGFGGFVADRNVTERTMRNALQQSFEQHAGRLRLMLDQQIDAAELLLNRPDLQESLDVYTGAYSFAQPRLERIAQGLRDAGFSGVEIQNASGDTLLQRGLFVQTPQVQLRLRATRPASLLWDEAYYLRMRIPLSAEGKVVGFIVTEQRLSELGALLASAEQLGQTSEIIIGYAEGGVILAFPSRFSPHPRKVPTTMHALVVTHAVMGEQGVAKTRDYRGNEVIAAFGPVPGTRLGLIVKTDTSELYAPIARQFQIWTLLLIGAVLLGMLLLRRQIRPLARRLMRSEFEARRTSNALQSKNEELEDSEARMRAVVESSADAVLILYGDGRIASCNPAAERIFGYAAKEIVGRSITVLLGLDQLTRRPSGDEVVGIRTRRKDGTPIDVEMTLAQVGAGGQGLWVSTVRDVSERLENERALQEAHVRLESGLAALEVRNNEMSTLGRMSNLLQSCRTLDEAYQTVGKFGMQLFSNAHGTIYVASPGGERLEAVSRWGEGSRSTQNFQAEDCWALRTGQPYLLHDKRLDHACAHLCEPYAEAVLCLPMNAQGEELGMLCIEMERDLSGPGALEARKQLAIAVSEQVALALANIRLRETLRRQSIHDPLTGLYNRRYLEEVFRQAVATAQRKEESLVVLMMDLDYFKRINDSYGHEAGDLVLQQAGVLLRTLVREADLACRFGGEEFALLMPGADMAQGVARAEELRAAVMRLHIGYRGAFLPDITASFGVAAFPECGGTLEQLLRAADEALYAAKAAGRNRVMAAAPKNGEPPSLQIVSGSKPTAK